MLEIEIKNDGGVLIRGQADELRDLAGWILRAVREGRAEAAVAADEGLTSVVVEVDD
jgi:hypothetical protein